VSLVPVQYARNRKSVYPSDNCFPILEVVDIRISRHPLPITDLTTVPRALVHQERVFCLQTSRPSDRVTPLQFKIMHIVASLSTRFKHLSGVVATANCPRRRSSFEGSPRCHLLQVRADRFCASGHSFASKQCGRTRTFAGHGQGYVQEVRLSALVSLELIQSRSRIA
jgi:hypothetical protein